MLKSEIQKLSPGTALIHIIPNQGFDGPKMVPCTFVGMSGSTHALVSVQRPVTGEIEKTLANRTLYLPEEGERVYRELRDAYDAKMSVIRNRADREADFVKTVNSVAARYQNSGVTVIPQEGTRDYRNQNAEGRVYGVVVSEAELENVIAFLAESRKTAMREFLKTAKENR